MEPRTKEALMDCIKEFWVSVMTVDQCNAYFDHLFKVVPVCVQMQGEATGDIPNRLFSDRSNGRTIMYFENLMNNDETVRRKAESLNKLEDFLDIRKLQQKKKNKQKTI